MNKDDKSTHDPKNWLLTESANLLRNWCLHRGERSSAKSVLIDDLSPTETLARLKMQFLGIKRRSYIQIRGFHGSDPATIDTEIAAIIREVRAICDQNEAKR